MRLDDAHAELISFLRRCHSAGRRLVLVITGKGRDTPDRYAPFDMAVDRSRRGVIRASVPRWLEAPELQAIVVSYSEAGPRHGGEGALYVRLRKAR
jgi:DNA-nicking Smr family endonuclease